MVKVLFFARLREQLGEEHIVLEQVSDALSVNQIIALLVSEHPDWHKPLAEKSVMVAVNQQVVNGEHIVEPGDEVAFFPPVTGG
ncbi:molybdopterin converting factor subunit 1 [Thalassotalea euphylliae]|uniref:molybdopterin converting factor subunit 1 n=1 Tax=Thalassotalea euphylliae TaxID=1655234 RepID=UPI003631D608